MTVLELNTLVKALEEQFGVSAAAMAMPVAAAGAGGGRGGSGRGGEDRVHRHPGGRGETRSTIKAVREVTCLGLKEAKDLVDGAPGQLKEGVSKDEAADDQEEVRGSRRQSGDQVVISDFRE